MTDTLDEWPPELLNASVRFWVCPVVEHRRRTNMVTVEWRDGVAHCTAPNCPHTSTERTAR